MKGEKKFLNFFRASNFFKLDIWQIFFPREMCLGWPCEILSLPSRENSVTSTDLSFITCGLVKSWQGGSCSECFLLQRSSLQDDECLHDQSCPTLWDSMDCSPPGSSVHEIFQARILEQVTISSSRGSSRLRLNSCLLPLLSRQVVLYQLSHLGSPISHSFS